MTLQKEDDKIKYPYTFKPSYTGVLESIYKQATRETRFIQKHKKYLNDHFRNRNNYTNHHNKNKRKMVLLGRTNFVELFEDTEKELNKKLWRQAVRYLRIINNECKRLIGKY